MRNYSYFAMPPAKTVDYKLKNLSYLGSKLWGQYTIPYEKRLRLGNLVRAHTDFAKFVYKMLDICN